MLRRRTRHHDLRIVTGQRCRYGDGYSASAESATVARIWGNRQVQSQTFVRNRAPVGGAPALDEEIALTGANARRLPVPVAAAHEERAVMCGRTRGPRVVLARRSVLRPRAPIRSYVLEAAPAATTQTTNRPALSAKFIGPPGATP